MTILVLGASGATGRQLVEQLLLREQDVRIIVRSPEKLPESWKDNSLLTIVHGDVLSIPKVEMAKYLEGCQAVAFCLGHTLSLKGIYGKPRRLVTDAVRLVCAAIKVAGSLKFPMKLVLMNTSGNRNRDLNEPISVSERIATTLIRILLPPHVDNEKAAEYLRKEIGQENPFIEWVAVRPDSLVDDERVSDYKVYPSPIRSPIFNPGKASRINVGHFMAELITNDDLWNKWKGQMPVLYNT